MVSIPLDYIHGDHLVVPEKKRTPLNDVIFAKTMKEVAAVNKGTLQIETHSLAGKPTYIVRTHEGKRLIDATNGGELSLIDEDYIKEYARKIYSGTVGVSSTKLIIDNAPSEVQSKPLPLWQVNFDDFLSPTLYISAVTGELVSKRHDLWRYFDVVWMLHIMDYQARTDVNNWLLRGFSFLVTLAALTGLWLLFFSFKKKERWLTFSFQRRKVFGEIHRWIGLAVGLQFSIWCVSGLVMSILPADSVKGTDRSVKVAESPLDPYIDDIISVNKIRPDWDYFTVRLQSTAGKPVYIFEGEGRVLARDAVSGEAIAIEQDLVKNIAKNDYDGVADILDVQKIQLPSDDMPKSNKQAWQVSFGDERDTALYISTEDGQILARRNNYWRVFDTFRMLHFMDYFREHGFNSLWIIMFAFLSVVSFVTGFDLIIAYYRRKRNRQEKV